MVEFFFFSVGPCVAVLHKVMFDRDSQSLITLPATPQSDPMCTLLNEIGRLVRRMEERLKQLKVDVQHGQEEALEKAAKKAREGRGLHFPGKSHQEQYGFNYQVVECLEKAAVKIVKQPTDDNANQVQASTQGRSAKTSDSR